MGLKLQGVPAVPATREDLQGKVVAIDAPNLLYAFYAVQLLRVEPTPERRGSALRAASRGLLQRARDLESMGARPLVVFDGPPHPLKRAHLEERDAARSVPAIGPADYPALVEAVRAHGVPLVQAPHDAEAQACAMARRGLVDVVATTDWDALAMGALRLLRNLSAHPAKAEGRRWEVVSEGNGRPSRFRRTRRWDLVDAAHALDALGTTRERLAAAAILMGCDYFPGFPGIGPKKALKLVEQGGLDAALAALGADADTAARARAAHALLEEPPWVEGAWKRPRTARAATLDGFA